MAHDIMEKSKTALRNLFDAVPQEKRDVAMTDLMTLERALYVLGRAIDFKKQVQAKAFHFERELEG